jgi:hypothetical protein
MQIGTQIVSCSMVVLQVPMVPYSGGCTAVQALGLHIAVVKLPKSHVDRLLEKSSSYPALHPGAQLEPDGKVVLHCPRVPFGGAETVQGCGWQIAAVKVPNEQLELPDSA